MICISLLECRLYPRMTLICYMFNMYHNFVFLWGGELGLCVSMSQINSLFTLNPTRLLIFY